MGVVNAPNRERHALERDQGALDHVSFIGWIQCLPKVPYLRGALGAQPDVQIELTCI